jgi:hypothetical protein
VGGELVKIDKMDWGGRECGAGERRGEIGLWKKRDLGDQEGKRRLWSD